MKIKVGGPLVDDHFPADRSISPGVQQVSSRSPGSGQSKSFQLHVHICLQRLLVHFLVMGFIDHPSSIEHSLSMDYS